MLTPSGRFAVQQKLCLSMSDFHPGDRHICGHKSGFTFGRRPELVIILAGQQGGESAEAGTL
jgi:hypothetical protein